jgi:hypothetical protein
MRLLQFEGLPSVSDLDSRAKRLPINICFDGEFRVASSATVACRTPVLPLNTPPRVFAMMAPVRLRAEPKVIISYHAQRRAKQAHDEHRLPANAVADPMSEHTLTQQRR